MTNAVPATPKPDLCLQGVMPLPNDLAVLLVAHGTVATLDELPAFLTAIRRGRRPSDDLIAEMRHRYEAIGGSPLLTFTAAQAQALSAALDRPVYVGMRFSEPSIEQALSSAVRQGIRRLVVIPMAPYHVPLYAREVVERLRSLPDQEGSSLELVPVSPWCNAPELLRAHCDNIRDHAADRLAQGATLLLTAHSIPRTAQSQDPAERYEQQVAQSAQTIAQQLGVPYALAFQSQGESAGSWLGPSLLERLETLCAAGIRELVVSPIGFLCDHVETLYDLDRQFVKQARMLGVKVWRVPALGVHPGLIATLAALVQDSSQLSHHVSNPTSQRRIDPT